MSAPIDRPAVERAIGALRAEVQATRKRAAALWPYAPSLAGDLDRYSEGMAGAADFIERALGLAEPVPDIRDATGRRVGYATDAGLAFPTKPPPPVGNAVGSDEKSR